MGPNRDDNGQDRNSGLDADCYELLPVKNVTYLQQQESTKSPPATKRKQHVLMRWLLGCRITEALQRVYGN